jgi:hypothetical protein
VPSNTTKHSVPVNSISIFGMVSASRCPTRSRATAGTKPPRLASLVLRYDDVTCGPAGKQRPDQLHGHGLVALRTLNALQVIGERVCVGSRECARRGEWFKTSESGPTGRRLRGFCHGPRAAFPHYVGSATAATQVAAVLRRDGPLAEPWFVQSNSAILAIFSSSAHGSAMCRAATFAIAPRFSSGRRHSSPNDAKEELA